MLFSATARSSSSFLWAACVQAWHSSNEVKISTPTMSHSALRSVFVRGLARQAASSSPWAQHVDCGRAASSALTSTGQYSMKLQAQADLSPQCVLHPFLPQSSSDSTTHPLAELYADCRGRDDRCSPAGFSGRHGITTSARASAPPLTSDSVSELPQPAAPPRKSILPRWLENFTGQQSCVPASLLQP